MAETMLSLSTDQVAAFVALAQQGSVRLAAEKLTITEQGARSRLLTLEERLGVELYRKRRGARRSTPLTSDGARFLPHAIAFLERAGELGDLFSNAPENQEIHIVASQYLTLYLLIDAIKRFHVAFPSVHVRLSVRTEKEIEDALLSDPGVTVGVAAPYEASTELEYRHLFSMDWSVITPPRHPLSRKRVLRLQHLSDQPLILFERGSTGRQHVFDAFHAQGITPRVDMEMTNTEVIVRMVEAGLGVSIVPLLPSGAVTRGRRVEVRGLGRQIRPIDSGVLMRRGEKLPPAAARLVDFMRI
jgi:DNA-binding transcriptional LysR family regulator